MANKKPSQRYSSHKLGSITGSAAIASTDYFIVQDASEAVADDQVRVTTGADLIFDLDTATVCEFVSGTGHVGLTRYMKAIKFAQIIGAQKDMDYKLSYVARNHATNGYTIQLKSRLRGDSAWSPSPTYMYVVGNVVENATGLTFVTYKLSNLILRIGIDFSQCGLADGGYINDHPANNNNCIFSRCCYVVESPAIEGFVQPRSITRRANGVLDVNAAPQQILAMSYALLNGKTGYMETYTQPDEPRNRKHGDKFVIDGWADFMNNDADIILPMLAKYGATASFIDQPVPYKNNFLKARPPKYTRADTDYIMQLIWNQGSSLDDHGWFHCQPFYQFAMADGYNYPSNDELRIDVGGGKNAFGYAITALVSAAGLVTYYLDKGTTLVGKTWANLTNSDCEVIRKSLSIFRAPRMTPAGTATSDPDDNSCPLLECLDYLSNRYLGTVGYGRIPVGGVVTPTLNKYGYPDYTDVPNVVDGKIAGGIFQGVTATNVSDVYGAYNHEVYERLYEIAKHWSSEAHQRLINYKQTGAAGGIQDIYFYRDGSTEYFDAAHTKFVWYHTKLTSSITGQDRSLYDILKGAGYWSCEWKSYPSVGPLSQAIIRLNECVSKQANHLDRDISSIRTTQTGLLDTADWTTLAAETGSVLKWKYDRDRALAGGQGGALSTFIDNAVFSTAQGRIPQFGADAAMSSNANYKANEAMGLELRLLFCKLAGIDMISMAEASEIAVQYRPLNNWFPNPGFRQTINEIVGSTTYAQTTADGWRGGKVETDATYGNIMTVAAGEEAYIRQYQITAGELNLSMYAMGEGNIKIYYIRNKTSVFTDALPTTAVIPAGDVVTISVNESNWIKKTGTLIIPDHPREAIDAGYPQCEGYHNQIFAIQITLEAAAGSSLKIAMPKMVV